MILILVLNLAHAQTVKWQTPEGAGTKFHIEGYRIMYGLQESHDCGSAELNHFVDVKNVLTYSLHDDPHFIPGEVYKIQIVSYNKAGISEPSKETACVEIRGAPEVDDALEVDEPYSRNESQGDANETYTFSSGSILIPRAHADELRGSDHHSMEPRRARLAGASSDARSLQTLLGRVRDTYFKPRSDRAATTSASLNDKRGRIISVKPSEPSMDRGPERMLRDGSRSTQRDESGRVEPIKSDLSHDYIRPAEPAKSDKRGISYSPLLGGLLFIVLAVYFSLKKDKP